MFLSMSNVFVDGSNIPLFVDVKSMMVDGASVVLFILEFQKLVTVIVKSSENIITFPEKILPTPGSISAVPWL